MTIKKVGGVYWLDVRIGPDKRRVRRSLKTDNYIEALDESRRVLIELKANVRQGSITLDELINRYQQYLYDSHRTNALRDGQRLRIATRFWQDKYGSNITINDIGPEHVRTLRGWLKGKNRAHGTINNYVQIIKQMYDAAMEWGVYRFPKNPAKGIKPFQVTTVVRALSPDEQIEFLKAAKSVSDNPYSSFQMLFYDLCVFVLNTGLRRAEVLFLKWPDVKRNGTLIIKGKGGKERIVPLNAEAKAVLERRRSYGEYVFHYNTAHRNHEWTFQSSFRRVKAITGLAVHLHMLRHTFATNMLQRGVPVPAVSKILGHTLMRTTQVYSHVLDDQLQDAVDSLLDT